jgi:Cation transport ATPase
LNIAVDVSPVESDQAGQSVRHDWDAYTVADRDGARRIELAVDGITCAACLTDIERGLRRLPGIVSARVNVSSRRTSVVFSPDKLTPEGVLERMAAIGYPAQPFDPATRRDNRSAESRELLKCMGVAGFGAMNVMLMSVSVWSGNVTDITPETRDFFHFMSALIAVPTVAYAARPFFRSASPPFAAGRSTWMCPFRSASAWPWAVHLQHADPCARSLFRQRADAAVLPAARPLPRREHASTYRR